MEHVTAKETVSFDITLINLSYPHKVHQMYNIYSNAFSPRITTDLRDPCLFAKIFDEKVRLDINYTSLN